MTENPTETSLRQRMLNEPEEMNAAVTEVSTNSENNLINNQNTRYLIKNRGKYYIKLLF